MSSYLSVEQEANIREDKKRGLPERKIAEKYGISRTLIRKVCVGVKAPPKKITKKTAEEMVRRKTKELVSENGIIQGKYIDAFEGIRQSIQDMVELNEEQKKAIPEMIENQEEIIELLKNGGEEFEDIIPKALEAFYKISNFYLRGKLRVESRKELGNWIDRFKDFKLIESNFKYYELVINSLFEAINNLSEFDYDKLRTTAVRVFPATERYFNQNEQQPQKEQDQPEDNIPL